MCEIHFLKKTNGENLSKEDLFNFISFMTLGDMNNSHAFGFFNSKDVFKTSGKFDYTKLNDKSIISDSFVVGHNRFATSGFSFPEYNDCSTEIKEDNLSFKSNPFITINAYPGNDFLSFGHLWADKFGTLFNRNNKTNNDKVEIKETNDKKKEEEKIDLNINNHPFVLDRFIMVHNGIIRNNYSLRNEFKIPNFPETDSYVLLFLINNFFKQSKSKMDKDKIVEAICKTTKLINGSFSVFLFDKISNQLFYFRNSKSSFSFFRMDDLILGSTNSDNIKRIYKRKNDKKKISFLYPKPNVIYFIDNKFIKKVGTFEDILQIGEKIKMKGGKKK
jgi:hypothetical protein